MNRANATLVDALFYFDTSLMVWVILGPLALLIAKVFDLSISRKALVRLGVADDGAAKVWLPIV